MTGGSGERAPSCRSGLVRAIFARRSRAVLSAVIAARAHYGEAS